jgi:N-acetylmuramoyl-L-alanine amidase
MGGVCPEPAAATTEETTQPTTAPEPTVTTTEETSQPTIPPEPTAMRVVTPTNALSAPKEGAAVVKPLALGETVTVTEPDGDWYPLTIGDQTCYIPADALRPTDEYLIVIDPGHQKKGNYEKEPVGPGATEKKAKVSSGTQGVATGIPEYRLTLEVSLKLKEALLNRGYQVEMVRTDHDVNISNAQRAEMANTLHADAFIRIHANGDENPKIKGIMTLCQTPDNPYNAHLYAHSHRLASLILEEMVTATGAPRKALWETDTMSGINWCQVPVTIVEMGYMSNPEEDQLMATEAYQNKLVQGIAKGIDAYFSQSQNHPL